MLPILLQQGQDNGQEEAIFRSAPMTLVQFYVTIELARDVVYALGKLGDVHFRDLNSKLTPFQRTFVNELRGIDKIESHLEYLRSTMTKYDTIGATPYLSLQADQRPLPSASEMDNIRAEVTTFYERIKHLDSSYNSLDQQKLKYVENRYVVTAVNRFHSSSLTREDDIDQRFAIHGDTDNRR